MAGMITGMSTDFERAKASFLDGVRLHEAGDLDAAERSYLDALAALPGRPSTLLNLALVRLDLGRPAEALPAVQQILRSDPCHTDAWAAAGRALQALGRPADELGAIDRLFALGPPTAPLSYRRGMVLLQLGRPEEALLAFDTALAIEAGHAEAWSQRGSLLREAGRLDEAAHCFRQALAHGGDEGLNRFYLAAVTGDAAAAPAPPPYVQALFDGYADSFEAHLVGQLGYRGHEALAAILPPLRRWQAAVDLGCGTGLCGPLLRPRVDRLHGVDLSPRMLDRARARGVYDRLDAGDLVDWLAHCREVYELVTAADVFIYFGDLQPVFAGVARVMAPGGDFAFSVEQPSAGRGVELNAHLRNAHGEAYLREVAAATGFEVAAIERQPLRHEQGQATEALICRLVWR